MTTISGLDTHGRVKPMVFDMEDGIENRIILETTEAARMPKPDAIVIKTIRMYERFHPPIVYDFVSLVKIDNHIKNREVFLPLSWYICGCLVSLGYYYDQGWIKE